MVERELDEVRRKLGRVVLLGRGCGVGLRETTECVGVRVVATGAVLHLVRVLGEEHRPAHEALVGEDASRQRLERLVVRDDGERRVGEEVLELRDRPHDGQALLLGGGVADLVTRELTRHVGDGVLDALDVLGEHGAEAGVAGVGLEYEGVREVGAVETRRGDECLLELRERRLVLVAPLPRHVLHGELEEWATYARVVVDELAVVVHEADEGLELLDVTRCRHGLDRVELGRVGIDPTVLDEVADEDDLGVAEAALLHLGAEVRRGERLEYGLDVLDVLLEGALGEHGDVVEEGRARLADELPQHMIDVTLEGGRRVAQSEWHHEPLVQAVASGEGGGLTRVRLHHDVIEGLLNVDHGDEVGVAKLV